MKWSSFISSKQNAKYLLSGTCGFPGDCGLPPALERASLFLAALCRLCSQCVSACGQLGMQEIESNQKQVQRFENRRRNVSYRSFSMPETSICQLPCFGCYYFSLEIAGLVHAQQASEQKPCVDLQESDAVWKAAVRYCLVTANRAWNSSVVIYQFAT